MAGTRSVLVIEPDNDRGGFASTLRREGVIVESAGDANRGLAGIASNRHALILVDPLTPGLNAGALVDALREAAPRPVTLVLVDDPGPLRGVGADVIHGYVRRGDSEQLAELIRDCLTVLRGTASQPAGDFPQRDRSAPPPRVS